MQISTFVGLIKKIQGPVFGSCSSYFHYHNPPWLHCASQDYFSTNTGNNSHFTRLPTDELALGYKPRIAGRKYLPGSTCGGFPEFLAGPQDGHSFPLAYRVAKPQEFDIMGWSQRCREMIDTELSVYGAILIRNLPLKTIKDFKRFTQGLDYKFFEHGVTGYRTPLGAHVYTASDDPPEVTMEPHNEVSHSPVFPKKVIMFCVKEPDPFCGGETVLLKNKDMTALLDPELTQKMEKKKIRYQAFLPNKDEKAGLQKSWQNRFWVDDPQEVENILETNGWSYSWDKDKSLRYWYIRSPTMPHPMTGEKIWFNQVTCFHASYYRDHPLYENVNIPDNHFPFHSYYGDGSDIEPEVLQHIRAAMWSCAMGFCWRSSDVAVLDNTQVLHGRMGWTGERTLVTALTDE